MKEDKEDYNFRFFFIRRRKLFLNKLSQLDKNPELPAL